VLNDPTVFVINLQSRPDRRDAVQRQLDAAGLAFRFFPAVDGRKVGDSPFYDRKRRLRLAGKPLLPGELGCYLSHLFVMQKILDEALPYAVVLEDDLIVGPDLAEVVRALPVVAGEVDMVKLGSGSDRPRAFRPVGELTETSALVRFNETVNGTQGYFVTRAGAETFIRYSRRFAYPVDVAINRTWENGLNVFGVQPWPILHDRASPTSIEEARFEKRKQPLSLVKIERRARKAWDSLAKRTHFVLNRAQDRKLMRLTLDAPTEGRAETADA
jgi:glycosyl transferase family 25